MPILIFDGPEKAGKSTLIRNLTSYNREVVIMDWGPVDSVFDYFVPLANAVKASKSGQWIIWDRSWASEHVYNEITGRRENEAAPYRFLEETADRHEIVRYMVLPPTEVLEKRRKENPDETDIKVDPGKERYKFERYAQFNGWVQIANENVENEK